MRAWCLGRVLTALAVVAPVPAEAQEPTVFLDGAAFFGMERFAHADSTPSVPLSQDFTGSVAGGSFAVGTFVRPSVSVRLEVALPGKLDSATTFPFDFVVPVVVAGPRIENEYQSRSATVLLGYHTPRRGRVRLGFLGGAAFVREHLHSVLEIAFPGFPPVVPNRIDRTEVSAVNYRAAVQAGFDADIAVASQLSIVPHVRAQAFDGALSLRPGIGVRWTP